MALGELESLQLEKLRREKTKRQGNLGFTPEQAQSIAQAGSKAENIKGVTLKEKIGRASPSAGQITGGILGSIVGGTVGNPILGGIAGATIGRLLGEVDNIKISNQAKGLPPQLTEAQKKRIGKNTLQTAGIEAITGVAGGAVIGAGKGILGALLGKRVAERGIKKGFRGLLDKKFFQDRVPKQIAEKVNNFFGKLTNVTGRGVDKAVRGKTNRIATAPLKTQANQLLKDSGAASIDDLVSAATSKAQLNRAKLAERLIKDLPEGNISVQELWKRRREFDKIRFRFRWEPDLENYLDSLRAIANQPIKASGDDVAQAFGRYSAVRQQEKILGNKFRATLIDDEIFTPDSEAFVNNLLSTNKDETVRLLQKFDSFLNVEDKVIEDLLDVAAAESLDKNVELMGLASRGILGSVGGKRAIAGTAAELQTPAARTLRKLIGRGLPTATTEALQAEQETQ